MAAEIAPLVAEHIEVYRPDDPAKRENWTVHFAGGRKAKTWSERCAKAIEEKAKGQEAMYELEPARDPKWAPKITKVLLNGEVLYDLSAGGGGQQRSGGGGGGGWRSNPEERGSIEAQVAAKIAGEIAVARLNQGQQGWDAAGAVCDWTPKIAQAIREAAGGGSSTTRSSEGGSSTAPAGAPSKKKATPKKAHSEQDVAFGLDADGNPIDDVERERDELVSQLLDQGMTRPGILARYNREFGEANGKATKLEEIPVDPLAELVASMES